MENETGAATDENPIKNCWYCKKTFDGNFEIKDLSIICPYCKRPQSSVFEESSQAEIIKKSKASINKSKEEKKTDDERDSRIKEQALDNRTSNRASVEQGKAHSRQSEKSI